VQNEAGFEEAARPWARYQAIVDNALAGTGARVTVLARFDPHTQAVRTVAWAGLQAPRVQRALTVISRLLPSFDPTRVTTRADVNRFQSAVLLEGKTVAGPLPALASGVVDERILQLAGTIVGLRHVFICPLIVLDHVEGSLSFLVGEALTARQQRVCEAFARQVSLTLENAQLLEALERQMAQVRESEERYRSLVETSPDAIALSGLDATLRMCNQPALALLGYTSPDEVLGRSAFEFIAPEDHERATENLQRTLTDGSVKNVEYTLLGKDGTRVPVELSASLIVDASGQPSALMAIVRDVAERKAAEKAVEQAQHLAGRLEGVMLAAREVAHLLSNDLQWPMSRLDQLQLEPDLPAHVQKMLKQTEAGLAAAAQHIRQLQQVVRVATRETPVGPALDLERSVEDYAAPGES
jgi:PAS domain S-box-containing protein